jgi:hypothetical protein
MPSASKINTPKLTQNQPGQSHTKANSQKMTDAMELYALLGQLADLADHARRGIDLAGITIAESTVQEMLGYAREVSRLMKKIGEHK